MLEILLYALGVMYTPGPVNLIALNNGIQKQGARAIHFYIGVGVAMFIFFFGFSLLGAEFIQRDWLFYFSLIGCTYIVYLAYKIAKSSVDLSKETTPTAFVFQGWFVGSTDESERVNRVTTRGDGAVSRRTYYWSLDWYLECWVSDIGVWRAVFLLLNWKNTGATNS
ncbi:LysE family transporter [Vibrio olivae]